MQAECSLPCSQEPSIVIYPALDQFSQYPHVHSDFLPLTTLCLPPRSEIRSKLNTKEKFTVFVDQELSVVFSCLDFIKYTPTSLNIR